MNKDDRPTEEERTQYELALDLIGDMISLRSSWIGKELKAANVDQHKIETWIAEQKTFEKERRCLKPKDTTGVQILISKYACVLREAYSSAQEENNG